MNTNGNRKEQVPVTGNRLLLGADVSPSGVLHGLFNGPFFFFFWQLLKISNTVQGSGEMAQWFRTLLALAEG